MRKSRTFKMGWLICGEPGPFSKTEEILKFLREMLAIPDQDDFGVMSSIKDARRELARRRRALTRGEKPWWKAAPNEAQLLESE